MDVSEETRSQDSVHASSQFAVDTALEDTVSSVHHAGRLPGSSPTSKRVERQMLAYHAMECLQRLEHAPHLRGLRRSPSPLGLSIAQRRRAMAGRTKACDSGNVWRRCTLKHEMCRITCMRLVEATTAKARSVRGEVESRCCHIGSSG